MKWTVIISAAGLLLGYALQMVLAAVSPKALGIYSTFDIYIKLIAAFVLIGGAPVISQYIPKIRSKSNFVFTYSLLISVVLLVVFGVISLFPEVFGWIGIDEAFIRVGLIILLPLVVVNLLLQYILNGFLDVASSILIEKIPLAGVAVTVLGYRLFGMPEDITKVLLGSFLVFYVVGIVIGLYRIRKYLKFKAIRLWLPKGFWKFLLFVHLATFLTFAYKNIDRIFVLGFFDIATLGVYQLIISLFFLTRILPQMFIRTLVPAYAYLLAHQTSTQLQRLNRIVLRYGIALTFGVTMTIVCFGRIVLGWFGPMYAEYFPLLLFSLAFPVLLCFGYVTNPLLTSMERTDINFYNSAFQIVLQFVLSLLLLRPLGIFGLLLALLVGTLAAQIYPIYVLYKAGNLSGVPREFTAQFFVMLAIGVALLSTNILVMAISFLILNTWFILLNRFTFHEIWSVWGKYQW